MAGITLAQAQAKLDALMAAHDAVLLGQKYEINGRMLQRADLSAIMKGIEYWNLWVRRLSARAAGRSVAITPRPGF